jgi:HD superfamily phosphodiesterase
MRLLAMPCGCLAYQTTLNPGEHFVWHTKQVVSYAKQLASNFDANVHTMRNK